MEMATTYDTIGFGDLGRLLRPFIQKRRVFLSACRMAKRKLALELLNDSECYSVLGPANAVGFADAALIWSSFYHLMFRTDPDKMKRSWLEAHARSAADLFEVPMNLFVPDLRARDGVKGIKIRPATT